MFEPTSKSSVLANPDQVSRGHIGLIVLGSIVGGLVLGLILALGVFAGAREPVITGAALISLACGMLTLFALSRRRTDQPQQWALAPAVGLGVVGIALIGLTPSNHVLGLLGWVWPPLLAILVVWSVLGARRSLHNWSRRALLYPAFVVLGLIAIGGAFETVAEATTSNSPSAGRSYLVDGHRLYLNCVGSGSPTVVLFNGLGERTPSWAWVQPAVARETRVCTYDRAGQGWSGTAPERQDGHQLAADLHGLLSAADVPGPYVLAGHSVGGTYALVYAKDYPKETAGIALIDSAQFAGSQPAECAGAVPDPVLVGDKRHPLPGRAVLQSDRASRLHVLPERARIEPVEVVAELEIDVQLLTALERRVYRLHHLAVLLAGDLARGAKAERVRRQIGDLLDQRRESIRPAFALQANVGHHRRLRVGLCAGIGWVDQTRTREEWRVNTDTLEIFVASYGTEDGAAAASKDFRTAEGSGAIDLIDAAVIVHTADGKVKLDETADPSGKKWAKRGAIAGGVVGLIFPPSIIVSAAVGGGAGGLWGKIRDKGFKDEDLKEIGNSLPPGTSAIIAVAEDRMVEQLERSLAGYEKIAKHAVSADAAALIVAEVDDESA